MNIFKKMTLNLKTLIELSDLIEKNKEIEEYKNIFLKKFNKKYPKIEKLLNTNYETFVDYLTTECYGLEPELEINTYLKLKKEKFEEEYIKNIYTYKELFFQDTNKMLKIFYIDQTEYLKKQLDFCLKKIKENEKMYIDVFLIIFNKKFIK